MSTILREYTALRSVGTLPFVDVILSAEDSSKDGAESIEASSKSSSNLGQWNVPLPLKEYLSGTHNPSQMQAIQVWRCTSRCGIIHEPIQAAVVP